MRLPAFRDDFDFLVFSHENCIWRIGELNSELRLTSIDPGEVLAAAELQVCSSLTILLASLNSRDYNLDFDRAIDAVIRYDLTAGDHNLRRALPLLAVVLDIIAEEFALGSALAFEG